VTGPIEPRTAVVTGASRGIGLHVARNLAERGVRVALLARSRNSLEEAAIEIGAQAIPIGCDVANAEAVDAMAARVVDVFGGPPDVIVNNAGLFQLKAIAETRVDDFMTALDVNLVAPFRVIRAFLPAMLARRTGHVVTIGSIADRNAFPENGAYAASKFGLRGLHEVLRAETRGTGVRATLVSPGPVDTQLWEEIDPDNRPGYSPRSAMLRTGHVAAAVMFAILQPPNVNIDELRLSHS
jgi:NADP-dependent 3-hydroxy acid dehydrogenase YdfG